MEEEGERKPFLICETSMIMVAPRAVKISILVCYVQVSTNDKVLSAGVFIDQLPESRIPPLLTILES